MTAITIPKRRTGRQSPAAIERYDRDLGEFCAALKQIDSPLEFKVSSRGWCYLLEESGLNKGDFDSAQGLINDCRKDGHLPIDFVIVDNARAFDGQEVIWHDDAETAAKDIVEEIGAAHLRYTPHSFWGDKDFYIQALVEKIDLKGIFKPVFNRFCIPYANAKGWGDLNVRADMMRRFKEWEAKGKQCVLLYCGDHDPGGLDFIAARFVSVADGVAAAILQIDLLHSAASTDAPGDAKGIGIALQVLADLQRGRKKRQARLVRQFGEGGGDLGGVGPHAFPDAAVFSLGVPLTTDSGAAL